MSLGELETYRASELNNYEQHVTHGVKGAISPKQNIVPATRWPGPPWFIPSRFSKGLNLY